MQASNKVSFVKYVRSEVLPSNFLSVLLLKEYFELGSVSEKDRSKLALQCLVEGALAVMIYKVEKLSRSKDIFWSADCSSHRAARNFVALQVGGTDPEAPEGEKHWSNLWNFVEYFGCAGARMFYITLQTTFSLLY